FDLLDAGRVEREDALDADVEGDFADREGRASASAVLLDDGALEHLNALLVALDDLVVHADRVAGAELGDVGAELSGLEGLDLRSGVHGWYPVVEKGAERKHERPPWSTENLNGRSKRA